MTGATVNRQNVFIGGAPRSGTTLLGSILGSHSQMLATPESQFKFELTPLFNEVILVLRSGILIPSGIQWMSPRHRHCCMVS